MFKFLVISAVFIGFAYADAEVKPNLEISKEVQEEVKAAIIKCGKPEDDPIKLMNLVGQGWLRQDQYFRDLLYCTYLTSGFVTTNGRFNLTKVNELMLDKEAEKAVKDCNSRKLNPVETTFLNVACFLKQGYHFVFNALE